VINLREIKFEHNQFTYFFLYSSKNKSTPR